MQTSLTYIVAFVLAFALLFAGIFLRAGSGEGLPDLFFWPECSESIWGEIFSLGRVVLYLWQRTWSFDALVAMLLPLFHSH